MSIRTEIAQARRQLDRLGQARRQALDVAAVAVVLATTWLATARPEQLLPAGSWRTWFILAGRGWGKTRTGAEAIATLVRAGMARRIAIVARTEKDLRNVTIPALQEAYGPGLRYYPSTHRLVFPNGAVGYGFSAGPLDGPRGYQFDLVWFDELAAFPNPEKTYDQFQFALRVLGARQIITTTPRPLPFFRTILAKPTTHTTTGRTIDNAANLDPGSLASYEQYAGTRLARQELLGELLDDLEGGLWELAWIEDHRVTSAPECVRTVVAIDPAVGTKRSSDEVGIIVVRKGANGDGFVIADLSGRMGPKQWVPLAAHAARTWGADLIVAESNNGGELIREELHRIDPNLAVRLVHSGASKLARAKPIAMWYELGRAHHVGRFEQLEDQLLTADLERGSGPDDRLDALVLGLAELKLGPSPIDEPGIIDWQSGIWLCPCGHRYTFDPDRPCPNKCGRRAPATYPQPGGG